MHIMEGFLPPVWAAIWWIIALPVVMYGFVQLKKVVDENRDTLPLLGICGALIFILSALKLPSVTGSCSHPTGTGLSAIVFGPYITAVIGFIVLLFQSLFLAHGGLSTLGANTFSMAICGPFLGYYVYRALKDSAINMYITVFLAVALADLFTYVITALELALAYPAQATGFMGSFVTFLGVFAVTQIPLAILEGAILALVFKYIVNLKPDILMKMGIFSEEKIKAAMEK
ncbi:MAG TPA: energy-coupling factor ABC transporter permease [Methanospirillum sp.]|uniref:energy-coupling factor ABC transporter permease n=1 Tax=Methanospirillum sp. TaxID=45200 RepID=UPI002BE98FE1|nr:energy-coupling factor ABC transporter permease [Methanospirillum sp.]HOJ97090.1 energy-coupling factor ABC transporter permease [Methanospirillum sp.]HOL40922.1 energy-coupling factor ABC transporter permease [Methanospirillum sp.]